VDILDGQAVLVASFINPWLALIIKMPVRAAAFSLSSTIMHRDACPVEQVGGQPDDPLDVTLAYDVFANFALGIAPNKNPMGRIMAPFRCFSWMSKYEQEGVITVFSGWNAMCKTLIGVVGGIKPLLHALWKMADWRPQSQSSSARRLLS